MTFLYPLGLLGLIGVPVIIIIYIIKNKHTEQIVTSTYLWNLSEKFLKRRKHIPFLSGLISLIFQILIIVLISLLIAHPVITIPDSAKHYCFVLDGSGSMNMTVDGVSLIEEGKYEIENIINNAKDGSKFTLVFASDTTRVIYEKLGNKEKAVELLGKLKPSGVNVDFNSSMKYVQEYFNENSSLLTYLVTDKDYTSSNINVINLSNNDNNFAILDSSYTISNNSLKISGNIISYKQKETIKLSIYIDEELDGEIEVNVLENTVTEFSYESLKLDFNNIQIEINNVDGLELDNSHYIYNTEKDHAYTTLIVSNNPFYLSMAIKTVGNTSYTVVSPDNYDIEVSGYSLYIFDSFTPSKLPTDGTIWMFASSSSLNGTGFSVQDVVENEEGIEIEYPKNSTSLYKLLTNGMTKEKIYITKYIKYGLYRNFTVLMTHEGNPIVFTGLTDSGCREVVFAFDLHDSNFPLLIDYLILTKNLIDYSFPIILEESSYVCGDTVDMNVLSNCDSIRVESPNGNVSYCDISSEVTSLKLTEAGTYKLIMMFGENEKVFYLYSSLPEEESNVNHEVTEMSLQGELQNEYSDGIYDKLIIFFIVLIVIYMADWMVYCYEQYQLR